MILELLISLTVVLVGVVVVNVLVTFYKQHKINQYFKNVSPKLPVPYELMSVYGGHTHILMKRNIFNLDKLHKKYGKTLGLYYTKSPIVATIDLDLIKAVVLDEPYKNINRSKLDTPFEELEVDSIALASDEQWRRLRQASAPAFTNHKLKSSSNVLKEIDSSIDKLVKSIEKKIEENNDVEKSVTLNLDDFIHRYMLELIFRSFFKQKNLIDFDGKTDYWVNLIETATKSIVYPIWKMCIVFPIFRPLLSWYINNYNSFGIMNNMVSKFITSQTKLNFDARNQLKSAKQEAEKNNSKFDSDNFTLKDGTKFERNLIDYFIDQFQDGKLTEREFRNTGVFLFLAADKTSVDAVTLLLYHLATNEEIQDKLRESILIEGETSTYLEWCIHESLRLFPPATSGCSRGLNDNYTTKEGYFLPKGTLLLTSIYSIHRSTEYWGKDADQFNPDRWNKSKDFHPCQYLTFGLGKRNCIGRAFALQEIKMLMNVLMRKFKFERSPLTTDNNLFDSPIFVWLNFDEPHYIKIRKI